jgi:hypothetical protein
MRAKSQSENGRGLSPFVAGAITSMIAKQKGTVPLSAGRSRIGSESILALRGRASLIVLWLAAWSGCSNPARAGGGPENLFLVVNSHSQNSLTVANHYIGMRWIPPGNVGYLEWDGSLDATDIETFRRKILSPALQSISDRGLSNQIDYLVYSSDFPTRIDFADDLPAGDRGIQFLSASITSLTYLYQLTLNRLPQYTGMTANHYMRLPDPKPGVTPTHAFRSWYGWGPSGELLESGGNRYLLSTMLAVTSGRGNTVPEALAYLRRSVEADGSAPKGTIYYLENSDVRSTKRAPQFDAAVADLKRLGIAAEVLDGVVPLRKKDVAGAMLGSATVPWQDSRSKILPGAIVENLTSFGGVFAKDAGQTPLTDFLRYGAAGSSGTVVEPYAVPNKFPAPAIHVHYGRGCSLAEAFYQSVWGPYQLLIVGDPLCRPWATIPAVTVSGVERGATVKGQIELQPTAQLPAGHQADHFELFVNGMRIDRCNAGGKLKLDTIQMADGYSELRVVAVEAGPIETQGETVLPIVVANQGRTIEASASAAKVLSGAPLSITVKAPTMAAVAIYQQSQLVGAIAGDSGELSIDTAKLGDGTVVFRAVGRSSGTPPGRVLSRPIYVEIEPHGK